MESILEKGETFLPDVCIQKMVQLDEHEYSGNFGPEAFAVFSFFETKETNGDTLHNDYLRRVRFG